MKNLLLALIFSSLAFAGVQAPSGEHKANSSDFFRKNGRIETWYYSIILDNGSKINVSYTIAKGKFYPEISLTGINGNYSQGREFDASSVIENRSNTSILREGEENHFYMKGMPGNGHHLTYFSNKDDGLQLELDFSSCISGSVPNGAFDVNGQTFGQAILIPNGKVKGTLRIGGNTQKVSGTAYMDHTWQSQSPTDLAYQGMQFQTYNNGFAGRIFYAQGGGYFGYAMNGDKLVHHAQWLSQGGGVGKSRVPTGQIDLLFNDQSTLKFTRKDQVKYDPSVNAGGWAARMAFKALVGSMQIYRGAAKANTGDWVHFSILDI